MNHKIIIINDSFDIITLKLQLLKLLPSIALVLGSCVETLKETFLSMTVGTTV